MPKQKIKATVDSAVETPGIEQGMVLEYRDGIPTIDDGLHFYISQLSQLEGVVYEAKYTPFNFEELIPPAQGVAEWQDVWEYTSYDGVTLGKFIGSNGDDLPRADINATKSTVRIGYAGNSYGYSLDELRKSQKAGIQLDTAKASVARRGAMQHTQDVAYFGDADRGMTGLFNNPNAAVDNSAVNWATASGQEIVADMDSLLNKLWIDSANTHVPNVLLLDSRRWGLIQSRRMDSGTDTTVLDYFKRNNLYTGLGLGEIKVLPRLQLRNAGAGNLDRMVAYELHPDNLAMARPIPWRALAPQPKGLKLEIPCEYKISGVELRYPGSMVYRDFDVTP